jgi:hypothetical protein
MAEMGRMMDVDVDLRKYDQMADDIIVDLWAKDVADTFDRWIMLDFITKMGDYERRIEALNILLQEGIYG